VGVLGVIVGGAGIVYWLCAGRREVGKRRLALLPDLAPAAGAAEELASEEIPGALLAADNMTRYHTSDCPFVAGKVVVAAPAISHRRAGRRPCGVCRPDGERTAT
jgi:hypothetical protein